VIAAPSGLVIRPFRGEDDLPEIVRLINAEAEADGLDERWSLESARAWFGRSSAQFDPARDVVVAELEGRTVGLAGQNWVDTRDGELREYRLFGSVDPAFRRRGIGAALLADNERRAGALAASQRSDRPTAYAGFAAEGRPGGTLLERSGYRPVRWFFVMVRPTLDDIDEPPLPDGVELRPVTADQHVAIWRANREAFRDHWGGSDESEEQMRRVLDDPDTDTDMWLIAWDGDEVAGGVWNGINRAENEALGIRRGWLDSVFTRRPWRRRGLAAALIGRSLRLLRERGMTSAALGVDADNPTGALGLYESAGFGVHEREIAWRKEFAIADR
jgi:mycothiol synthase